MNNMNKPISFLKNLIHWSNTDLQPPCHCHHHLTQMVHYVELKKLYLTNQDFHLIAIYREMYAQISHL